MRKPYQKFENCLDQPETIQKKHTKSLPYRFFFSYPDRTSSQSRKIAIKFDSIPARMSKSIRDLHLSTSFQRPISTHIAAINSDRPSTLSSPIYIV